MKKSIIPGVTGLSVLSLSENNSMKSLSVQRHINESDFYFPNIALISEVTCSSNRPS